MYRDGEFPPSVTIKDFLKIAFKKHHMLGSAANQQIQYHALLEKHWKQTNEENAG